MPSAVDNLQALFIRPDQVAAVTAGSVIYPINGTYGPRIQQEWQLVSLHSGWVQIQIDDQVVTLEPGEICLLEPGCREYFQFSREGESWHRWISVILNKTVLASCRPAAVFQPKIKLSTIMNQMIDTLLQARQAGLPDSHPCVVNLGLAAVALYLSASGPETNNPGSHPAIDRLMTYIRQSYPDNLKLDDLARAAGLSRAYLVRLCRQICGRTPMQLLWRFRLDQGVDLLKNSGLTVGDIAERCGYAAYSHFARSVRRLTGQSPTGIRNNHFRQIS